MKKQKEGFFSKVRRFISTWEFLVFMQMIGSILVMWALIRLKILSQGAVIALTILLLVVLFVVIYLMRPDMNIENNSRAIVGKGVSLGLCVTMFAGSIAMTNYRANLSDMLSADEYDYVNYSVIVLSNGKISKVADLDKKKIAYRRYVDVDRQSEVFKSLMNQVDCEKEPYSNYEIILDDLYDKEVDAFLINESDRALLSNIKSNIDSKTKVVWKYQFKEKVEKKRTF